MPTERDAVTCSVCGMHEPQPPITWIREVDRRRGTVWVCQACAREHLRSIESRLDQRWW